MEIGIYEISFTHIFSFICNLTLDGICYTFGVFLVPLMGYFEVKEKGPISMIGGTIMSRNENELVCTHDHMKSLYSSNIYWDGINIAGGILAGTIQLVGPFVALLVNKSEF